jgi:hypothetical protein
MRALLAKGADVNKRGGEYGTALQASPQVMRRCPMLTFIKAAAFRGDSSNVELLLDHGALLNTSPIGYYGNELQGTVTESHTSQIYTNF